MNGMTDASSPSAGWQAEIHTGRDHATLIEQAIETAFEEDPPSIASFEEDEASGRWKVQIYFAHEPDRDQLERVLKAAVGEPLELRLAPLADRDWVALSQALLPPIRAGRFFVHGSHARDAIPAGVVALEIDAGQAFGTGGHETTHGCLVAIDRLARGFQARNVLDLGCGTGILALAAARVWRCPVMGSDIDPVAVDVARRTARANGMALAPPAAPAQAVAYETAAGLAAPRIRRRAPFDLIIANILMKPLCTLAPDIEGALGHGGKLILSGLLNSQAPAVFAAYRNRGLTLQERLVRGQWTTLVLKR